MVTFSAVCRSCDTSFVFHPIAGAVGFLNCPECSSIVSEVDVTPWNHWVERVVEKKKALLDRSHPGVDPDKASRDGTGAELAACLCLCPGFLDTYLQRAQIIGDRNVGKDLLGPWIGYSKDFEIKYTPYYDEERLGILYIRRPANMSSLEPTRDVLDCIYVLFNGIYPRFFGTCWADKTLFYRNGVMNPSPMPPGKPVFGNHHSRFNKFSTIAVGLGLGPASVKVVCCKGQ